MGQHIRFWDRYDLSQYRIRTGCFSQDARGRWYLNVVVRVKRDRKAAQPVSRGIAIDLGLKDLLATSGGIKVGAPQFYRDLEGRRADHLHKLSSAVVRDHGAIFVGNVNAPALA